ncbi:AaceriAEL237Wp [[Ashbya] aceris (nom. inval.)]|nr:AaceriAEL237Wp [[Ashbya] aceris (nom. inval.)]
MDVLFVQLMQGVQPVTRVYVLGMVGCIIAHNTGVIEPIKYDFSQIFHKRQYYKLLLSCFDVGTKFDAIYLAVTMFQLSYDEQMIGSSKRFLWFIAMVAVLTTGLAYAWDVKGEMPMVDMIKSNLTYYTTRTNIAAAGQIGFIRVPALLALLRIPILLRVQKFSLAMCSLSVLPGYVLYLMADVAERLFHIDLMRPPDEWF